MKSASCGTKKVGLYKSCDHYSIATEKPDIFDYHITCSSKDTLWSVCGIFRHRLCCPLCPCIQLLTAQSLSVLQRYPCRGLGTFMGEEMAPGLKSWERCHNRLLDRSQHKPQQLRSSGLQCFLAGKCVCHRDVRPGRQSTIGLPCHLADNWPTSLRSPAVSAMTISHHELPFLPGSQNSNQLTNAKTDLWKMLWHVSMSYTASLHVWAHIRLVHLCAQGVSNTPPSEIQCGLSFFNCKCVEWLYQFFTRATSTCSDDSIVMHVMSMFQHSQNLITTTPKSVC